MLHVRLTRENIQTLREIGFYPRTILKCAQCDQTYGGKDIHLSMDDAVAMETHAKTHPEWKGPKNEATQNVKAIK